MILERHSPIWVSAPAVLSRAVPFPVLSPFLLFPPQLSLPRFAGR
jgi:hypothetical protein